MQDCIEALTANRRADECDHPEEIILSLPLIKKKGERWVVIIIPFFRIGLGSSFISGVVYVLLATVSPL